MAPGCLAVLYFICPPTFTGPSGATLAILLAMALETKLMRILTHCCAWSLLFTLSSCSEVFADFERIQLGNQQYCIPKEYRPYQYGRTSRVFSFAGADTDNRPASLIVQFQGP